MELSVSAAVESLACKYACSAFWPEAVAPSVSLPSIWVFPTPCIAVTVQDTQRLILNETFLESL